MTWVFWGVQEDRGLAPPLGNLSQMKPLQDLAGHRDVTAPRPGSERGSKNLRKWAWNTFSTLDRLGEFEQQVTNFWNLSVPG